MASIFEELSEADSQNDQTSCVISSEGKDYPEIMTFEEVAAFLRVSAPTLRESLMRKQIPGQKIGNQWRISKQSLLDCLSGKSHVLRSIRRKK